MKTKKIAPSLLSADFSDLNNAVQIAEKGNAHLLHLDVMDGHFVPNLTFGPMIVSAVHKMTDLPLDVHLMIENPGRFIDEYIRAGTSYLSFHIEATRHVQRVLRRIKDAGIKAGLALNPHTPVESITDVLDDLDFVLIMSVNPGFGGQSFIPGTYAKLTRLSALLDDKGVSGRIEIEVDGGVKPDNLLELAGAGADIFVSGSGIYRTPDPVASLRKMYSLLQ